MEIGKINVWIKREGDKYILYGNDYRLGIFDSKTEAIYLSERSGIEIED